MDDTLQEPPSPRRVRAALVLAGCFAAVAGAVALAAVALVPDRVAPSEDPQPTVVASAAGAVIAAATLTSAVDPRTGAAVDDLDAVDAGEPITAVVEFRYEGAREGQDSLFILWLRGDEELQRNAFRLPQPGSSVNATLGAQQTAEAGEYRAEVRVGTTVTSALALTLEFEVRPR